jgi:hypothetical protein
MAVEKLKRHKAPSIDQTPTELIKAVGRTIHFEMHKLIKSVWNMENCLNNGSVSSLYLFLRSMIKEIAVTFEAYYFRQQNAKFYPTSCW